MHKAFRVLRGKLQSAGIDQLYLAEQLDRSVGYISRCMNAQAPWRVDEMYTIMTLINEPIENLHIIFPRDGKLYVAPQKPKLRLMAVKG